MRSVGALLGSCLRDAGVARVFGAPVSGLPHVAVDDPLLADRLADADGRIGPGPGAALHADADGWRLRLSSRVGGVPERIVHVAAPQALPDAVTRAAAEPGRTHACTEVLLAVDLDAPPPDVASTPRPTGDDTGAERAHPLRGHILVLAGPYVSRLGARDALQQFASSGRLGVANTWGAKGVFTWDSPHHMGTCGLQAHDFELLGFADADLIVATGVDPDESALERYALAPTTVVAPDRLTVRAREFGPPFRAIAPNALYERLAAVAQPGYLDDSVPLHPARAVADLRAALPPNGLIAADPGVTGLWVARTFPTTDPGSIVVPATRAPGVAAALALCAALRGRPAIAVTTAPVDATTLALCVLSERLGASFVLSVWDPAAHLRTVETHAAAVTDAITRPGVTRVAAPVDLARTQQLVDVAGPVVAWGGLAD